MDWPPQFILTKSSRARHVRLKASLKKGLEIVVPLRFNQNHIPDILEKNKNWIIKKLNEVIHPVVYKDALPFEIDLKAIYECWKIEYVKIPQPNIKIFIRPQQELVLLGNIENIALCKKTLIHWIKLKAKQHLPILLNKMSEKLKLPYASISIRAQKSRWGSCSDKRKIVLNYKILLLPEYLAQHILIHELCHTQQLNHSDKFWMLVESFDPNWKEHRKAIKKEKELIPYWLDT